MTDDLEDRLRAHYDARDPGPAPDHLRQRVHASLAGEPRYGARLRRVAGLGRAQLGAMGALVAVVLIATAGLLVVVRPWQGQGPAPGGPAATPDPRCTSLTIDDVEAALRDTGSYRYAAAGYLAPAGPSLGATPPPARLDVTGTGSYLAPDRYIETWQPGDATDPSAAGLSMADTLRVGNDQWTRDPAATPPLWEKLEWPGSSDPRGGLIRLNWIDFERERAGWASDPRSDMAEAGRCVLVGGPGMLETGGTVTVWLAVDPSTALPAAMRVEIDNTVGGDSRLDYTVEYGVPVDIPPPGPDEVMPSSASPAAERVPVPAAPVPEPFELRIYNAGERTVGVLIGSARESDPTRIDFGLLACGESPLVVRAGLNGLPSEPWIVFLVYPGDQGTGGIDVHDDGSGPQVLVVDNAGASAGPERDQPVPSPGPCQTPAASPSTAPSQSP
jgi:hypothetical protein